MAMNLLWFKDLAFLAETGNFSQAAGLANVTQPAMSRRIRGLENWVGATLVDRSSHPVRLTSAGRQMLEAGQQALSRIEIERNLVRTSLAHPDKYVVTFAAQQSIGWRFYPAWLQALEEEFGPIMSRLRADDLPNCMDDLKNGEVDYVIAYESEGSAGLSAFPDLASLSIGTDALIPVCKSMGDGSPLFHLDDQDRLPIPYLRFGDSAPIGQHVAPLLRMRSITDRLTVVYEHSMSGALRIRARDGAGVAWLPRSLVKPELDMGSLALAGNEGWSVHLDIRLYRLNAGTNPLTQEIWEFLFHREGTPLLPD